MPLPNKPKSRCYVMPKKLSDFLAAKVRDRTPEIRACLRKLGNRYVDQTELCAAAGLSTQHLAKYREQFTAHLVPVRDRAHRETFLWAGTAKLAKQMREVSTRG